MKFLVLLAFGVVSTLAEESSQVLKDFSIGNTKLSANIYKELLKTNSGNFLVCPLSVEVVLALAQTGAKGQTAQEISSGLNLPQSPEEIQEIFTQLKSALSGNDKYNLSSANKIYLKNGLAISDSFKTTAVNVFDAEIQNIDFTKNVQAAAEINKWVEVKTHDKIKDLIGADALDENTLTVLVNAMYFQGKWVKEFDRSSTSKKPFRLNAKNQIEVDTMRQTNKFNYYESPEWNAKFLEMPYQGDDITMTVVLPNDVEGLGALEARIADVLAVPQYNLERVYVEFPKFKIETTIKFNPILQALGIEVAFSNQADFSGITNEQPIKIDTVVHKAFIEVDEKETVAAAATGIYKTASAPSLDDPPKEFIADHPFIFYLKHQSNIMFVGRYVKNKN